MLPFQPTERLREKYGHLRQMTFTSPEGVPEDEVGNITGLVGAVQGGPFDGGPIIRTFWKPTEEEIHVLINGGVIELDFYNSEMLMTAMNVEIDL